MKNKLWVLALLATTSSFAQTNAMLTWEQCLEKTRFYNPDLISARAAVKELEYGVSSASSGFLPQVSASASANYGQEEDSDQWSESKGASGQLSLSQDLYSGGSNFAKRNRSLAQLDIGHEQYRSTLSDVELRTRLAYIEVLYTQDLIKLTETIDDRRAANVRLIQLRFDGGRENAGSLARTKAQLSQAEYEANEAKRALNYARRNLAAAIGVTIPVEGVQGDLQAAAPEDLMDLESLMKQTPTYSIAWTQIEASKQGLKVTRSQRFPTVRFSADVATRTSTFNSYDGSWGIGLSASVPLFTGHRISSEVAAVKEQIIQDEMSLMDTSNTLLASLQEQWNSYANAVESEAVQKELFAAEQLRAKISTAKYKQGLLSYEDWDTIESTLITQGKTHLQRRRSSEVEQARWKNALGLSIWQTTETRK
ncbi:MAG: TolC family protein [Pontiella sp.]